MHIKTQHKEIISAVHVIEGTLHVAWFHKKDIPKLSHVLLQLFLLRSPTELFSYTETAGEVTLIVDKNLLSALPLDIVNVSQGWKCLEVTLGDCGYTESGIIARLTSVLSNRGISVHYLSTYNTDYILVPEHQLSKAILCFMHSFGIEISVPDDTVNINEDLVDSPSFPREDIEAIKLEVFPASMCLARLDKEDLPLCMDTILRLIFFPNRSAEEHFLSFTETTSEFSMIIDQRDVSDFPQISCMSRKLLVETHPWRAIKRLRKLTFYETGVVSAISTTLAATKISLLYLSAHNTSFIMVRENTFKEAVNAMRKQGFEVLENM